MIGFLFGNKSIEHIFFYLLINGRCYASQLHQQLDLPLTPVQQALRKLEKGGVLQSQSEGKTRYYSFNPTYPLLIELEALLKKGYSHLPLSTQKKYFSPTLSGIAYRGRKTISSASSEELALNEFWDKLLKIKTMCFSSKSKAQSLTGWNGTGKGVVDVKRLEEGVILFQERGVWSSPEKRTMDFSNTFRWTLNLGSKAIALEHLRFGPQHPVFLFDLVPVDINTLESIDSHICQGDTYFGQVRCHSHFIQFNWRVIGPKKNEEIDYIYTE